MKAHHCNEQAAQPPLKGESTMYAPSLNSNNCIVVVVGVVYANVKPKPKRSRSFTVSTLEKIHHHDNEVGLSSSYGEESQELHDDKSIYMSLSPATQEDSKFP